MRPTISLYSRSCSGERRQHGVGVGILGLQVGQHVRVLAVVVAQPVVLVRAGGAERGLHRVGFLRHVRRRGRAGGEEAAGDGADKVISVDIASGIRSFIDGVPHRRVKGIRPDRRSLDGRRPEGKPRAGGRAYHAGMDTRAPRRPVDAACPVQPPQPGDRPVPGDGAERARPRLERAGFDVIHMEVGEPDFTTAAPIVEAGRAALAAGRTRYTGARGLRELREALSGFYRSRYGLDVSAERILVTPAAPAPCCWPARCWSTRASIG
jgi:hypothetical protein